MAMLGSVESLNRIGAIVALMIYASCSLIFCARLAERPRVEHPHARPSLYYIQISLMIVFVIVELLLHYVLKIPFRHERWMVVVYVMLFFGATGGMLGVAAAAGRGWTVSSASLFLMMAVLAFVQRARTGMSVMQLECRESGG